MLLLSVFRCRLRLQQNQQGEAIDHYLAQVLPEHKADLVEQLQAKGKFICYVGDGVNDAIALKKRRLRFLCAVLQL